MKRVLALCVMWSTSSLAAGNVYAVLPTQGAGATTEAALAGQTMRLALQEQSLALVPQSQVEAAALANTVACSQSIVACGRLVGQATGATHVVLSELWDQANTLELKVALLDVRVERTPEWTVVRTTQSAEIGPLSKKSVLALVSPSALSGSLSVAGLAGLSIVVDGVALDKTPLVTPLRLTAGPHEVELRSATVSSSTTTVQIASGATTELLACEAGGAVSVDPAVCASSSTSSAFPMVGAVGGVGLGLGVVGGLVAVTTGLAAQGAYDTFVLSGGTDAVAREDHRTWRTTAAAAGLVGATLAVAGAAAIVVELVVE